MGAVGKLLGVTLVALPCDEGLVVVLPVADAELLVIVELLADVEPMVKTVDVVTVPISWSEPVVSRIIKDVVAWGCESDCELLTTGEKKRETYHTWTKGRSDKPKQANKYDSLMMSSWRWPTACRLWRVFVADCKESCQVGTSMVCSGPTTGANPRVAASARQL